MKGFLEALSEQRWDDHRYYHHSRINQSLHLFSAMCFLVTYVLLFTQPVVAAIFGWFIAMVSRQVGHFFFEPKGYDEVNASSHEYKESIKIGYNLRRKIVLLSLWAATPFVLYAQPNFFGQLPAWQTSPQYLESLSKLWIGLAGGALVFRTVHLFFIMDVKTGVVWLTKILTDPFHDIKMYWRSPLHLMRGELMDPIVEGGPQH